MSVEEVQRRSFFNWLLMWAAALFGAPFLGLILIITGAVSDTALLVLFGIFFIPVGIITSVVVLLLYAYLRAQDFSIYLSGTEDSILAVSPWWAIVASSVYSAFYSGRFREHLRRQGNPMADRFPDPVVWIFIAFALSIAIWPLAILWIMYQEYSLHSAFYDLASPPAV